jgi:hypothetical protein
VPASAIRPFYTRSNSIDQTGNSELDAEICIEILMHDTAQVQQAKLVVG